MKRKVGSNSVTDQVAALSDAVRLRMLRVLEREELAVGEVARVVQLPQSTVSRHLKVLSDGGWVFKRAEGTATLYRMVLDDLPTGHRGVWVSLREMMRHGSSPKSSEVEEDMRRLASVLDERRGDAQAFFGRVAGQWDDVRTELFGSVFSLQALLHLIPREQTVADLGCGTGNISEILAPLVKKVIAVDASSPMLSAARKRLAKCGNVRFVASDIARTGLGAGEVDTAIAALVLCSLETPEDAIREMGRIVKVGGRGLIVDIVPHDRASYRHTMGHRWLGFAEETIVPMFERAGFADVRYATLPPDTEAKGPGVFVCTGVRGT